MRHDTVAVYAAGVALAVCSCGWRERLEHGTRAMARGLADDHERYAVHADEDVPSR